MAVKVIKAKPRATAATATLDKIRVGAYCRVSRDTEDQETSYEAQCEHWHSYISSHPNMILVDIYADEGISGTGIAKRDDFNRMMNDAEAGKLDLILTKSISRWARNTLDMLNTIRHMKELNVAVEFEKEAINTLDSTGEVLLTILGSIAQQESASISQNVRMGIQYRFQAGRPYVNASRFLGYDKIDGQLVINPEQAKVVQRIYREFLEGQSPERIAQRLRTEQVPTAVGTSTWPVTTVRYILSNEKYCGDLLLQKTMVEDFLTHKSVKNNGALPQYYVENSHPPIIPREVFQMVQGELYRRSSMKRNGIIRRYGNKTVLSGRVVCGRCGGVYKRFQKEHTDWRCGNRVSRGGCIARIVKEDELQRAISTALARVHEETDNLIRLLERNSIERKEIMTQIERVKEREEQPGDALEQLQIQLAELYGQDVQIRLLLDYIRQRGFTWASVILSKENKKTDLSTAFDGPDWENGCTEIDDFFLWTRRERGYDDAQTYVENITVEDEKLIVNFKAGVSVIV